MSHQQTVPYVSRDKINYFYHVGLGYPELTIANSQHRLFVSLFQHRKSYVVSKVMDCSLLDDMTGINLTCYKKGCALFLELRHINRKPELSFKTIVPVDPVHSRVDFPLYPDEDELLEFESHFIDAFTGELKKIVRCIPTDPNFIFSLVAEYQSLLDVEYNKAQFAEYVRQFYQASDTEKSEWVIATTEGAILKQIPDADEPPFDELIDD